MRDNLITIYEQMYGTKNTVQQVEQAIQTNLRGSGVPGSSIIEQFKQANGYPKNEPAKPVSAKDHVPEEVKPAIEAPEELSPAVDSSTSKQKLTTTITDKEKKHMASHKFSFDELYKTALSEQMEIGAEEMEVGGEEGPEGEVGEETMGEEGGDVTVTLSRDAARAICDALQAALEEGGEEEMGEEEEGPEGEAGEGEGEEGGEDLEEATKMDKAPAAKSGAHAKGTQKVADPTTLNKGRDFTKANINPHAHVKVQKPKELKYTTTG